MTVRASRSKTKHRPSRTAPHLAARACPNSPSGSGARAKAAMAVIHRAAHGRRAADTGALSANWKAKRRTLRGRSISWSFALILADHAGSNLRVAVCSGGGGGGGIRRINPVVLGERKGADDGKENFTQNQRKRTTSKAANTTPAPATHTPLLWAYFSSQLSPNSLSSVWTTSSSARMHGSLFTWLISRTTSSPFSSSPRSSSPPICPCGPK